MQEERVHVFAVGFDNFLKEFQDRILQGYRVDIERTAPVFWNGFSCNLFLEEPWIKSETTVALPLKGPLTVAEMEGADWEAFRAYVKENYGLTDRNRKSLIKKVLAFYDKKD